ncbi:AraC family transcriptional regulator [Stappia sp.]|uniref:helix-turn-helix transcriptional regulator n=1 Tax=Stappia sp. TaxID=1870903 RepID=UPI0032D989BD
MTRFLSDVTPQTIRDLGSQVKVSKLCVAAGGREQIAAGRIWVAVPEPGVKVMVGTLAGQRGYRAEVAGDAGLTLEVRLAGTSQSRERGAAARTAAVSPGDLLLTGSRAPRKWDVTAAPQSSFEAVSVSFSPDHLMTFRDIDPALSAWGCDFVVNDRLALRSAPLGLRALAETLLAAPLHGPGSNLQLAGLARQILAHAYRLVAPADARQVARETGADLVAHALEAIRSDPHAHMTIDTLARACRTSPSRLKSLFRAETGRSIGSEIRSQRMLVAKRLLLAGTPIARVAETLGYTSSEAFSKAVKAHYGRSPRDLARG